jgi:multidrug efflux pump subunit AcrA (membrane-fusion protein)
MHPLQRRRGRARAVQAFVWLAGISAAAALVAVVRLPGAGVSAQMNPQRTSSYTVVRRDFVKGVRLSGTVEAIQSMTVAAPRLTGPNTNSLVITRLVRPGSRVEPGQLIVEFDRQQQLTNALDRRAELQDLEQQIRKREAQERAAAARDEGEIQTAESTQARAELEMVKNEMIPKIHAEKNTNALEQAKATLRQLRATFDLKREAAEADLRILRIRRDRAANAMRQAETNADRMAIKAPIGGMAVLKTVWKGNTMAEVQEGEEVRAGVPVVDIVNPNAMRVRARVNQADINALQVGQRVAVGLDAYPDLHFPGSIAQISPLGITSTLSPKVRQFIVLVEVQGSHPNLMPDLTASLDVELARLPRALVVPRDAIRHDGERAFVRLQRGSGSEDRDVTIAAASHHEAVVAAGLDEGAVILRNAGSGAGR